MSERRLDSLEGLRFLSSLVIVAGHYVPYVVETWWITHTHLAVDLFFVISGIVIAETYAGRIKGGRDYARFIGRRWARLYPLHLLTFGFYLLIGVLYWQGVVSPVDGARYNPQAIVPNLLLTQAWLPSGVISFNYVSWSISAEMFVYLLFPLIAWAVGRRLGIGLLVVALLLAGGIAVAELVMERPLTRLSWDFGIVRALPSFAFGVWVSAAAPALARRLPAAWLRPLCIAGLAATAAMIVAYRIDQYIALPVIWATVALAFLCDRAGQATPVSGRWLAQRGALTYSIYMLHTVVATVVMAALGPRLLGNSLEARLAAVLVALVALYALSVASLRWFEQPLRHAINRWADHGLGISPTTANHRT